jgi:hypothetical protein
LKNPKSSHAPSSPKRSKTPKSPKSPRTNPRTSLESSEISRKSPKSPKKSPKSPKKSPKIPKKSQAVRSESVDSWNRSPQRSRSCSPERSVHSLDGFDLTAPAHLGSNFDAMNSPLSVSLPLSPSRNRIQSAPPTPFRLESAPLSKKWANRHEAAAALKLSEVRCLILVS